MKVNLGKILAMMSLSFFSIEIWAQELPRDLKDLQERWNEVIKTSEDSMSMQAYTIEGMVNEQSHFIFEENTKNLIPFGMEGGSLEKVTFKRMNKNVRKEILKSLFGGEGVKRFCSSYPRIKPKIADEERLTDEEKKSIIEKANANNCKKLTEHLISGIVYANPTVYSFSTVLSTKERNNKEVVFYINSVLDSSKFLKYSFKV